MPFVFVHGVNNRKDAAYLREEKIRVAFLREFVAPVVGINPKHQVFAPYWGGDGVSFWRDLEVIPSESEVETFGGDENELPPSLGIAVADGSVNSKDNFVSVAQRSPDVAIDLLFDAVIQVAESDEELETVANAYRLVHSSLADPASSRLMQSTQDEMLEHVLNIVSPLDASSTQEAFGGTRFWELLQEGAKRLTLLGPDQLSHAVVALSRRSLTQKIASFIGDAFRYLNERGDGKTPGPIASVVLQSLQEAFDLAREKDEPLVVISHSFGGEIVYDVLTHYAEGSNLQIDAWVTVGSQVGLFEEMSLLWTSPGRTNRAAVPREAITSPKRVKRWVNIIDTNDVLGFLVLPTFTASVPGTVHDFKYNTGYPVTGAHSGYFKWPSFYKRLAHRISEKK